MVWCGAVWEMHGTVMWAPFWTLIANLNNSLTRHVLFPKASPATTPFPSLSMGPYAAVGAGQWTRRVQPQRNLWTASPKNYVPSHKQHVGDTVTGASTGKRQLFGATDMPHRITSPPPPTAKGKQPDTEALCHTPPPPRHTKLGGPNAFVKQITRCRF